jgi:hypothetical protein
LGIFLSCERVKTMKRISRLILYVSMFFAQIAIGSSDLIIFSYNRPLQLYALLESLSMYVTGVNEVMVIYRAGDAHYEDAYQKVRAQFNKVTYYAQENAPHDFKRYTLDCISRTANAYVAFAVDDIVVKDYIDLDESIRLMRQYDAYGFFLRLGKNLDYCYATLSDQKLPEFLYDDGTICLWNFEGSEYDWGYPHSLDMTIYRKADLMSLLSNLDYNGPNQLEHYLALNADYSKKGVCYQTSKIINLPINLVQTYTYNNCQNTYGSQQLLTMFNDGFKMDIKALFQANNRSSHMYDAPVTFIAR